MRLRAERILNWIIVLGSLVLIGSLIFLRIANTANLVAGTMAPGTRIDVPGITWQDTRRTVVLALSTRCPYCTASAYFYRRLKSSADVKGYRLVAVFPQPSDEARSYLESLHLEVLEIRELPLNRLGVTATPTLIVVDSQGRIVSAWVGQLSPAMEAAVVSTL